MHILITKYCRYDYTIFCAEETNIIKYMKVCFFFFLCQKLKSIIIIFSSLFVSIFILFHFIFNFQINSNFISLYKLYNLLKFVTFTLSNCESKYIIAGRSVVIERNKLKFFYEIKTTVFEFIFLYFKLNIKKKKKTEEKL